MAELYLSTIGEGAAALAREFGLGIEIAEFSYAANMDADFPHWDAVTRENISGIGDRILHAPYNELCTAAVDPMVSDVTRRRLEQAFALTRRYRIDRMVVHSGYMPYLYFKEWFVERSAEFWQRFLFDKPADFLLLLENVMEESPDMLLDIIERVGDDRLRLCLDVGHAGGAFSKTAVISWVEASAPYLAHVHVHNNYHTRDLHNPPGDGLIDMRAVMAKIIELQPVATFTAETADLASAVAWFKKCGFC